jgi:hypothetical protein
VSPAVRVNPRFDLTIVLNYYAPYVSGVTEVARALAEGLAAGALPNGDLTG